MLRRSLLLLVLIIITAVAAACQRSQAQPTASAGAAPLTAASSEIEALLAFARCMQANGVPEFPDPQESGINLLGTGIDHNAPEFKAAKAACESVIPRGSGLVEGSRIVPGESEWEQVVPAGDCRCADGSEFAIWVRQADPTKVVFALEGGGACWNATTCAFTGSDSTTYDWNITGGDDPGFRSGVFDLSNPDNPLADYSFVFVPYCTGDVHLGTRTQEYAPGLTVAHNGFANGRAALDYLTENYPDAQEIVILGLSAGAVAAPVYAGLASDVLPNAHLTVLADSGGAYPNDPQLNDEILGLWGVFATMPAWGVNDGLTAREWGMPRFWVQSGRHNPDIVLARFDFAFDAVQTRYMELLELDTSNLIASIDANEAWIEANGVIQHSYTAPGNGHTVLSDENFYALAVNGVPLVEWVAALIAGEPLDDIHCNDCAME